MLFSFYLFYWIQDISLSKCSQKSLNILSPQPPASINKLEVFETTVAIDYLCVWCWVLLLVLCPPLTSFIPLLLLFLHFGITLLSYICITSLRVIRLFSILSRISVNYRERCLFAYFFTILANCSSTLFSHISSYSSSRQQGFMILATIQLFSTISTQICDSFRWDISWPLPLRYSSPLLHPTSRASTCLPSISLPSFFSFPLNFYNANSGFSIMTYRCDSTEHKLCDSTE